VKRFVTSPLKSFLSSAPSQMAIADCLTLTLPPDPVYGPRPIFRITSFDRNVTIAADSSVGQPGGTFDSMGSRMRRSRIESKRGMETSQLTVTLAPDVSPDLSGGVLSAPPVQAQGMSLGQAAIAALLYGATARLETVYGDPAGGGLTRISDGTYTDGGWGSLIKFVGVVADIEVWKEAITLTIVSQLHRLEPAWPPFVFQPSCRWRLFDAGCTLDPAAFQVAGTALAGSTPNIILNSLTNPAGYFSLGQILFMSGQNAGLRRSIQASLPFGVAGGYVNAVLADGPLAYYRLNDAPGTNPVIDSSGNGFNASVIGGVGLGATPSLMVGDTGTCAVFDGATGYLTPPVPTPPGIGAGLTFEFWYTLPVGAAPDQPRGIFDSTAGVVIGVADLRNNGQATDVQPGVEWASDKPFVGFNATPPGVPMHVVAVFRGANTIDLFINGVLFDSQSASGGGLTGASWRTPFWIGRTGPPGAFFNGTLQHFALYDYALSGSQAAAHFAAGTTAPSASGAGSFVLLTPFPYAPAAGDSFFAWPGCSKTTHDCGPAKFNNLINYGGMPFVPSPEVGL
jgi:hypothetical protein